MAASFPFGGVDTPKLRKGAAFTQEHSPATPVGSCSQKRHKPWIPGARERSHPVKHVILGIGQESIDRLAWFDLTGNLKPITGENESIVHHGIGTETGGRRQTGLYALLLTWYVH